MAEPEVHIDAIDVEVQGAFKMKPLSRKSKSKSVKMKTSRNKWIRDNIKMKDIIDSSESRPDGKPYRVVPTTCFGDIDFKETTKRSRGKFIRLSEETDPATVWDLMKTYWQLEAPHLIISVTGGAKALNMDRRLQQNFKEGLLKVTETPGTWVISGGTNTGVMKLVGDAMHGSKTTCIGILSWGVIANREHLIPKRIIDRGGSFSYCLGSYLVEKKVFLEYNHSHFLMVDNGTDMKFGVEIPFRAKFEEEIMMKSRNEKVPTVLLVLEGGPGTLGTVVSAVENKNPIPVVLVKDSGRTADLLIYALGISDEIRGLPEDVQHGGVMRNIRKTFPEIKRADEHRIIKAYKQIVSCINMKETFTIADMGTEMDVDDSVLTALLNDSNTSNYEQLRLTIIWDRADLAEKKILTPMTRWKGEAVELNFLMIMALAMNRISFVRLFLDYGISIRSLLTNEVLQFLYAYRSQINTSTLRFEFKKDDYQPTEVFPENKYTPIFNFLRKHAQISPRYGAVSRSVIQRIVHRFTRRYVRQSHNQLMEDISDEDPAVALASTFQYPFRELFFWAVLNNMLEMAMFLWEFEEEAMAKALIASQLSFSLAKHSKSMDLQDELIVSLEKNESTFRNVALQLLDVCHNTHEANTEKNITTGLAMLPGLTCLDLAIATDQKEFVAHSAVQGILNDVWTGPIKARKIRKRELILSFFFPFYLKNIEYKSKNGVNIIADGYDSEEGEEEDDDKPEKVKRQKTHYNERKISQASFGGGPDTNDGIPLYRKIFLFYQIPMVKFAQHVFGYLLFLCLVSYVAMMKKTSTEPGGLEILCIITVGGYMVGEIYQVSHIEAPTLKAKLREYITDFWNMFDWCCIMMFIIGLILRLSTASLDAGQLFYALDALLWILRLLHVFHIHPTTGPYVVMIGQMFIDMMYFLAILFVFLLAYGVAVTAILTPMEGNVQMLIYSVFHPYFNIYGELFIEDPTEKTTRFDTPTRNTYAEPIAWVLLAGYLLVANILLLNLLIAVFNNRYEKVMQNAAQIWKFGRYGLIIEYSQQRIALFPPFSLLGHLFIGIRLLCMTCGCFKGEKFIPGLKSKCTDEEKDELREFENNCLIKVVRKNTKCDTKHFEDVSNDLMDKIDSINISMVDTKKTSRQSLIRSESSLSSFGSSSSLFQDSLKQIEIANIDLNSTMKSVEERLKSMEMVNENLSTTLATVQKRLEQVEDAKCPDSTDVPSAVSPLQT